MLDKYKYFVTSTHHGNLLVWKLSKKKSLIHEFKSHTKKVSSLQTIPSRPNLFISASTDNSIRIFSLDKFTELYSFILPNAGVKNITLLPNNRFAAYYRDIIRIGALHHMA